MSTNREYYLKLKEASEQRDIEYGKIEKEISDLLEADYLEHVVPRLNFRRAIIPTREEMYKRYGSLLDTRARLGALRKNTNEEFIEFRKKLIDNGLLWGQKADEVL